jgi:photosystem II stability/assembly factor-like uncharacterized protein
VQARQVSFHDGDVLVMVGTMKGAFLARSTASRRQWELAGPYFPGHPVYAIAFDAREGRRRLWAAPESSHFGSVLQSSDDFGRTWTNPEVPKVRFPEQSGVSLKRIWQIEVGPSKDSQVLYCGVEPAALFQSRDAGETWSLVQGLFDHPHRARWQPGGGGLCLHTIVLGGDGPSDILVAISTGGVYKTSDGGRTWRASNQGVRADFLPDKHPEFGQCVHKVARAAGRPERLYLQNHWGLYRSDDAGASWKDIAKGVPSDFGFPIVAHPRDADTAYIIPMESDEFRCAPEGKLRVYRTQDGGGSWHPLSEGLPQNEAFETVLRDGLANDRLDPSGVYFGTRSGKLFGSDDEGSSWRLIREGLPPIVCVKTALVGEAAPAVTRRRKASPNQARA